MLNIKKSLSFCVCIIFLFALCSCPGKGELEHSDSEVGFICFGDNLIHEPIYRYGEEKGGNYDFLYAHVRDKIEAYDFAVINQETPLTNGNYSDYPHFATPDNIASAIKNAGFDIAACATNHMLDRGYEGVLSTAAAFDEEDVLHVGINTLPDSERVLFVEKNGIDFAICNYTFSLNGIEPPENKEFCVNTLFDESGVRKELKYARENSEVLIVFVHWGTEYSHDIDEFQKKWTDIFSEEGVDVVVGTHPHVLEPYGLAARGDGSFMLVFYSLGNFISCQIGDEKILGGAASFSFSKTGDKVVLADYGLEAVVTHQEFPEVCAYMLSDYNDILAGKNRGNLTKEGFETLFKNIMEGKTYEKSG